MTENALQADECLSRLTAEFEAFGWRLTWMVRQKTKQKCFYFIPLGLGYEVEKGEWYKIEKNDYILANKEQKLYRKRKSYYSQRMEYSVCNA